MPAESRAPQMERSGDSRTPPQGRLGLHLARLHITEPQLSTAGPASLPSSFTCQLPGCCLTARVIGPPPPGPQARRSYPSNLAMPLVSERVVAAPEYYYNTCKAVRAPGRHTSAAKNEPGSSYPRTGGSPRAADTPQVTGL